MKKTHPLSVTSPCLHQGMNVCSRSS